MWKWVWHYFVPNRIKKDYKYVGLDLLYLKEKIEIFEEELVSSNPTSYFDSYHTGQLTAYKDIYDSLNSR